jgi:hypothetical protein
MIRSAGPGNIQVPGIRNSRLAGNKVLMEQLSRDPVETINVDIKQSRTC